MKIKDLNQHCGECDIIEYCGNPFGFCLCTDERFGHMEEIEYKKITETIKDIKKFKHCEGCKRPACEAYRYSAHEYADEDCEYSEDYGFNSDILCPTCKAYIGYYTEAMCKPEYMQYCNECGQRIDNDWSGDDE